MCMGHYTPEKRARKVITIDEEGKTYMWHAEKICWKIKILQDSISPPWLPFGSGEFRYTIHCFDTIKGGLRIAAI
jgi:hypothetical protein